MFVPVYRQLPLSQLAAKAAGQADYDLGAGDIEQAWDDYWNNDNIDPITHRRRGVVLLGHSQGSAVLATLMRRRIDGNPERQRQLVSAVLLGGNVIVPLGRDAGDGIDPAATFQFVPVCRRASPAAAMPTGCVIAYSTYNQPGGTILPPDSHFGRADPIHQVVCVDPAAVLAGVPDDVRVPVVTQKPTGRLSWDRGPRQDKSAYPSGFAGYVGRVGARCMTARDIFGTAGWLQVDGDDAIAPPTSGGIGLHAADWELTQGDIDALIGAQVEAWTATHS